MERIVQKLDVIVPTQPKVMRVAAYARVSSGKDAMLHSLSAQISYYSEMIQNHGGWLYCGVFSDEAITGTKEDRPGFQGLMAQCRAGNIDFVITKSISRFARNTVTLLETTRELKSLGVDVFFEEQNIHTMSADGELMMTILASYAQEESRSASENMKWRIRKGFENGELVCLRYMFGYIIADGEVKINPAEAIIVREMYNRAIDGESLASIGRDMESRGIVGRQGGKWPSQRVKEILSNEKYTGNALLQKHYRNNHIEKKKTKNRGELPMFYAEGTHPAIIDMDTFRKAQAVLKRLELKHQNMAAPEHTPFRGKLVCGNCGANYRRVTNHGRKAWNCGTFQTKGKAACPARQIPESELYRTATEVLELPEFDPVIFERNIRQILAERDNTIIYCFHDGRRIVKQWMVRSRSESWTEERRAAARQQQIQRRSE